MARSIWAALVALVASSPVASAFVSREADDGERREVVRLGFENEPVRPLEETGEWMLTTPGWRIERTPDAKRGGELGVALSPARDAHGQPAPFGNLLRSVDPEPYRGKRVAYRVAVRVAGEGRAQPWIRVDRPDGLRGAFDNMHDRPIASPQWTEATIEVDVADDATAIVLGVMAFGEPTVSIDDVTIEVLGAAAAVQAASPPSQLGGRALANVRAAAQLLSYVRFFHPSDQARGVEDWGPVGIALVEAAEPATDAGDLARRLEGAVAGLAPTVELWATEAGPAPARRDPPPEATAVVSWMHRGAGQLGRAGNGIYASSVERLALDGATSFPDATLDLALDGGVTCRLPLKVYADAQGTLPHGRTPEAFAGGAGAPTLTARNRSTRLAGVALAWGVFQHFYPYFDVIETDWDGALSVALAKAATDADETAFLVTMQELVAALHDGHGNVHCTSAPTRARLPLALAWAGENLVVVGTCGDASGQVSVGDELEAIGGRSAEECLAEAAKRISHATDGWLRSRSSSEITGGAAMGWRQDTPVPLLLRSPDGTAYSVRVTPTVDCMAEDATAKRPENGSEVAPGIVYFNLDGAGSPELARCMDRLLEAKGIVFDLRGYPGQAAYEVVERLIDGRSASARWTIPVVRKPNRADLTFFETGRWDLSPRSPRLPRNVAFLTDGRAISYAESIMGIVEEYGLGEIVGSTTAGTNGNVNPFTIPGGYSIYWTGMRVLKHDGSTHHGVGIAPTVPVEPTPQGIAEGRDEVLGKAVEILSARTAAP